jgi:hypothetical protein
MTSMQPPHVQPVTECAGPRQLHGLVGTRSPKEISARVAPVDPDVLRLSRICDQRVLASDRSGENALTVSGRSLGRIMPVNVGNIGVRYQGSARNLARQTWDTRRLGAQ